MAGSASTTQPPRTWWEKPTSRASTGPLLWLMLKTWFDG
jgi:hypothetical protein